MPTSSYDPKPLDTSNVELPRELEPLLELMAENAHDVWAAQRRRDGWVYGPRRDDAKKQSPVMIPYAQLSESDKEYDRQMSAEALRFIVARGFQIVPPVRSDDRADMPPALAAVRDELGAVPPMGLPRALELWQTRMLDRWPDFPELYALLGERLLRLGEPLLAHDVLAQARRELTLTGAWSAQHKLRHLLGLALARSGATEQARDVAIDLRHDLPVGSTLLEDVVSLEARTLKDLASMDADPERRRTQYERSHDAYLEAFRQTKGSYSAINAATTALLAGAGDVARDLAGQALEAARTEMPVEQSSGRSEFWQLATIAEAELVLGHVDAALDAYRTASEYARQRRAYGDLASTRRQARLIATGRGVSPAALDAVIRVPTVVLFTGHRIDNPARASARFPAEIEERVRAAIRDRLAALDAGFGFSSAANGGDILFQEEMLARGGETCVVLPYGEEEFYATSVAGPEGGNWKARYETVLARATERIVASDQRSMESRVLVEYANSLLLGMAILKARLTETSAIPLAVWDGQPSLRLGGTGSTVAAWQDAGYPVHVIDITSLRAGARA